MNLRVTDAQNQPKYEKHEIYENQKTYINVKNNEKIIKMKIFRIDI